MRCAKSHTHLASVVSISLAAALVHMAPAAEAPAEPAKGSIVARVVSETGAPQPGAHVSLFSFNSDWRRWDAMKRDIDADETGVARFTIPADNSYIVRAGADDDRVGYRECLLLEKEPRQEVDVRLAPPMGTAVSVRDESGKPVAGARIWAIEHSGANGSVSFDWQSLRTFGFSVERSSAEGELLLPPLPPGTMKLRLIHDDFAPAEVKEIRVGGEGAQAILQHGVKISMQIAMDQGEPIVDAMMIDLRHSPFEHPSTLIGRLPRLRDDGFAQLTVAEGEYHWLRLQHPDYVVTPVYSERYGGTLAEESEPFKVGSGVNMFNFRGRRKVKVRGRVIDDKTGEPVAEQSIEGELPGKIDGPFARFADEWSHIGWGETNDQGEYDVELATGRGRVSFSGQGLIADPEHHVLNVAADGSTQAPDFRVRPMPKVRGVVLDRHGAPAAKAVVRFRGSRLTYAVEPVITDDQGRFELKPPWMPIDLQTHEKIPQQTVVAFDPVHPDYGYAEIRLDEPESLDDVVLRMAPQDDQDLIMRFPTDLTPWQRGLLPADKRQRLAAISLAGKSPPELDGAHWLNSEKRSMSLVDFRGQ